MNESISTTHNSGNQSALFDRSTVAVYGGTFTLNHSVTTTNANPGLNGEGVLDKAFQKVVVTAMHDNDDVVQAPKCHPGTRTALIGRLIIRAQDTDADCFLIWLVGPAGAGKSSIARSFAEEMEDSGIRFASFFFFRTDPSRNSVKGLVLTLAYQISHSIPEFKQYLALALAENTTIFHRSLPTQFKKLITLPLGQVLASHPSHDFKTRPFVILIDGLDECNDRESRRSFLQLVHKAIPTIPGLRFVVTSRPEEDIQAKFDQFRDEDYEKMELLADISAYDDIRTFLGAEFVRIRTTHPLRKILKEDWPSCRDTEDLVRNSSGHFIYPATAIKYIEYALDNPQRSLQVILGLRKSSRKPLADLDALYGNILDSSRACRKRLRDILSIMIALSELGRSKEWIADTFLIEALLGLEEGDVQLGLLDIRSIVEYDPTSSVPFFHHRSFADFLLHKSRSGDHYIGSVPSFDLLIKKCFQRLSNPRNFLDTGVGPLPPAHLLKNTYHSLVLRWFSRIQQGSHSYGFIRNHLMAYDPLDADEQDFTVSQVGSFYGGQILAICEKFKNLVNDEEIFEFHLAKLDACVVSDIEKMPWPPIVTLNILALRVFPDTFSFDEDSEEKALHKPYKLFPPIQSLVSAFGLGYSPHFRFVGDFFFAEERAGKYWINEDVLVSATRWCFQNLLQIIGHGRVRTPTTIRKVREEGYGGPLG
ncbi:hypothetical protein CPB83DRAFT_840359 [Crepidotus variabilis]|uniref:NACHT domain-containing protein n=1 Tax=Crepidotus variabilis TaxID=179855 RepID=A0A9P6E4Z9_9AGAR|nr:hypothetical protein CPB83DRAFT_840359 [Crepidotus variabilis]